MWPRTTVRFMRWNNPLAVVLVCASLALAATEASQVAFLHNHQAPLVHQNCAVAVRGDLPDIVRN